MNPFHILLILFITVPLLEIYLLIQVGGVIGALPTVFLVVFTAVLGVFLIRRQGLSTMQRVQATIAQGEIPAVEMLEGTFLLISGALLLTPGFFTDTLGFLCLVPPLRRHLILKFLEKNIIVKNPGDPFHDHDDGRRRTIEGEYWRDKDHPDP
ncbi:MAG TPA: FxsA family protein [Chromatiales bacterium]|nr:FxsA family protein [Chromatiales bacterium]